MQRVEKRKNVHRPSLYAFYPSPHIAPSFSYQSRVCYPHNFVWPDLERYRDIMIADGIFPLFQKRLAFFFIFAYLAQNDTPASGAGFYGEKLSIHYSLD